MTDKSFPDEMLMNISESVAIVLPRNADLLRKYRDFLGVPLRAIGRAGCTCVIYLGIGHEVYVAWIFEPEPGSAEVGYA